ncbi:MAG: site-specific integrase [Nitrospirae bacterium]|nr:site-specific integrase [Nitrospirota bacterium]
MAVYKRGNSWYIDFVFNGTRVNRKAGNTKSEAKRIEEELKTKLRLKMLNVSDLTDTGDRLYFHVVAEEYLDHIEKTKSKRNAYKLRPNYINHVKDFFYRYSSNEIDEDLLIRYQGLKKSQEQIPFKEIRKAQNPPKFQIRFKDIELKRANSKKNSKPKQSRLYSNRAVNIYIGIVRKIRNFAISKKYIKDVRIKYPHLPEPKKLNAFVTPDEFEKLAANLSYDLVAQRIRFGRLTGMRPAELSYLTWNDVNFNLETVKVQGKGDWKPKTNEERTIPLCDEALEILKDLFKAKKGRWVFSTTDTPVRSIQRSLKTASEKAGLNNHVTPNMIRHTFATHALWAGADIKSVMDIMGHKNIETTNRYLHSIPETLRRTVQLVQNLKSVKSLEAEGGGK